MLDIPGRRLRLFLRLFDRIKRRLFWKIPANFEDDQSSRLNFTEPLFEVCISVNNRRAKRWLLQVKRKIVLFHGL